MPLRIILLLFILGLHFSAVAQSGEMVFLGSVEIKGSKSYSYKIHIKDSSNIIKGFSVTDLKGPDETKTAIWGTINTSKREIHYRETALISTKSQFDKDSFCFIHTRLKVSDKRGIKMLRGNFTGYKKDGRTRCGNGTVSLIATDDLLKKLMKYVDTTKTPLPKPAEKPVEPPAEPDNYKPGEVLYVAPGNTMEIICYGNTATLEVWDHEKVDGDVISLAHNGKTILDKHSLTGVPRNLSLALSGKGTEDVVTLIANNEGAEPPATFRVKLVTGDRVYTVQASTTLGAGVKLVLKSK